jgi:hypothetical protein
MGSVGCEVRVGGFLSIKFLSFFRFLCVFLSEEEGAMKSAGTVGCYLKVILSILYYYST